MPQLCKVSIVASCCSRNSTFRNLSRPSSNAASDNATENSNNDDADCAAPLADDLFRSPKRSGGYTQGDATYLSCYLLPPIPGHSLPSPPPDRMRRDRRPFKERLFPPILRAFGRAGLPFEALQLFDEMLPSFRCAPSAFSLNSALSSLLSSPHSTLTLPFFRLALRRHPSLRPNLLTFNLVLKSLCSKTFPSLSLALHLFRSISLRGLQPDAYSYSTLIAALARDHRLDDAFALLDEMQLDGVAPNSITFNSILHAILRTGNLRRAVNLTRYMLLKDCPPTLATYNTLVHGLCRHGRLEDALSLIGRMVLRDGLVPNEITYGTLIDGLVKLGRAEDAHRVFDLMRERGVRANEYVYSALITGLFRSNDPEEALKLWEGMISDGVKPNAILYTALVDGLCRHSMMAAAEDVIPKMIADGCTPNVRTYSALMWGHFRAGNGQRALATWMEMLHSGCEANAVSYSILIHGLCQQGRVREGMMVWKNMISRGYIPDVVGYTAMIRGLCVAGRVDGGMRLFYDMLACGDAEPDAVTYNSLFDGLIKGGELVRAVELLGYMLERGCEPDEVTCNIFLKGLEWDEVQGRELMEGMVVRMLQRGKTKGAAEIVLVMGKKFIVPRYAIWEKIVCGVCKMRKVKVEMEKFWKEMLE
ncbi:hypothetical protein HPP92_010866 [Vanilla planifolia]|uniref:Pentatricopeptide repeat-containing protein n=1 Tax=Vanilla planifolia TaxID=51239 RepID=A0A835V292_VANPL|nr:hypothetical protein HPP92_010866 [Vanilla planifolia]